MKITPKQRDFLRSVSSAIKSGTLTQTDIALDTGLNQAQISRILSGKVTTASKGVRAVCRLADQKGLSTKRPASSDPLDQAIREICGGSDEAAQALLMILRGISRLVRLTRGPK